MTISTAAASTPAAAEHPARAMLLVAALGVVFGDIGTSPIYAFRESLRAAGTVESQATVLGILSLVFWAVVLVVALKYVVFVMRADNQGEGGTMALISLALPAAGRLRAVLLAIGLGGASVFLALTGGEALYADMGHFGRRAIRIDWFALVMPALVLNYLGQGALVLADASAAANPFFLLFPGWLLIPLVGLTTAATVIASQAVISGAFTLVQQAIPLGAVPRLEVRQNSAESARPAYVPPFNWLPVASVL